LNPGPAEYETGMFNHSTTILSVMNVEIWWFHCLKRKLVSVVRSHYGSWSVQYAALFSNGDREYCESSTYQEVYQGGKLSSSFEYLRFGTNPMQFCIPRLFDVHLLQMYFDCTRSLYEQNYADFNFRITSKS
jgi:hypothetical protein